MIDEYKIIYDGEDPFGLALLSLALVVAASASPLLNGYKQGDKCPAKQFFDDCNRCVCSNDGHSAACTRKACPPDFESRSVPELPVVCKYCFYIITFIVKKGIKKILLFNNDLLIDGYKHGDECPAEQFYDDCNSCICSADGHSAVCTLMACLPRREARSAPQLPVVDGYKQGDKCPAKQFFDDCNRCVCGNDGHSAACTRKACPPDFESHGYKHGDECPAQQFYNDCNKCACSADGHSAACTLMACPPRREARNFANINNKLFFFLQGSVPELPVVCKYCFYIITFIVKKGIQNILLLSNDSFIDGYKHGDECPAQQFYNDCNRCACSADGHSAACTLMACSPRREAQEYQQGDKCPAQQFFDKCNRCLCAADGHSAACTRMACPPQVDTVPHIDNFDEIKKCTPYQHFQKKCNSCICTSDGASALCTLVACLE
ncbi:hypothetical protein TSAR_015356 [Trichomalopsis sarcophagae]|uniref:Pacifastin domain-containing protein n=1 Tax=Trichomalopsis sarcophagae TaxID=543379 RepID=A0A232ERW8_9HYME|nr:hypothetical protein TSAR_015356 [Trichomalopsis sarcophagae]